MAPLKQFLWSDCGDPISDERIKAVEHAFGVKFPEAFLALVRECDGGDPGDLCFKVKLPGNEDDNMEWTYGFGRLLSFREPMPREIRQRMLTEPDAWREVTDNPWSSIEEYAEGLPPGMDKGLIPFAENGGGDFLCFDYRENPRGPNPPIVIWLLEFTDYDPVVRLANNFDAFLSILGPCEPAEYFGPLAHLNRRADE